MRKTKQISIVTT